MKVAKTEKPTQKGGWIGLAAGAGVAVVFPFLLPPSATPAWPGRALASARGSGLATGPAAATPRTSARCSSPARPR